METSTNKVALYKGLSVIAILGLILSLIGNFIFTYITWPSVLSAIFKIFFVIALILLEFRQSPDLVKPFSFMFYFLGRGIFYLILGFITMGYTSLSWVGGFIIIIVGIIFIVLHYVKNGQEPEYMTFSRYQRLTSGMSHELPTTSSQQYPVAHQVPLSQHNVPANNGSVPTAGQYNNTHNSSTHFESTPASPLPVDNNIVTHDKTEI